MEIKLIIICAWLATLYLRHIVLAGPGQTFQMRLVCGGGPSEHESGSVLVPLAHPLALDEWATIELNGMAGGGAVVNGQQCDCPCRSGGPIWAFLGEGFLDRQYAYSSDCTEHDLSALQTGSVEHPHASGYM